MKLEHRHKGPKEGMGPMVSIVLVGAFNQEKAQVGAFSVIVKLRVIFGNLRFKL